MISLKSIFGNQWNVVVLLIALGILLGGADAAKAQTERLKFQLIKPGKNRVSIPFKLVHNLIIVPAFINNSDTLNFILDTGISNTLITGFDRVGNVTFNMGRKIPIQGLGTGGMIEAFHSYGNTMRLQDVISYNHDIIVVTEGVDFISQSVGMEIHGLIGYDIFSAFVVEINYASQHLVLYRPSFFNDRIKRRRTKKGTILPIVINNRRPYLTLDLMDGHKVHPLRLLIDTGASYALSIFRSTVPELNVPVNALNTLIGTGLNGEVYGRIYRGDSVGIGPFLLQRPVLTLPDEAAIRATHSPVDRNGSVGSDIFRRFRVIFDYRAGIMILRPNSEFNKPFMYNTSGLELMAPDPVKREYRISSVLEGSPAWKAGMRAGDLLTRINSLEASECSIGELIEKLQSKPGRVVRVRALRDQMEIRAKFKLKDMLDIPSD